jgi:MATE family multidrug resistance protein
MNMDTITVDYAQMYVIYCIPYLFMQTQVDLVAKWLNCF